MGDVQMVNAPAEFVERGRVEFEKVELLRQVRHLLEGVKSAERPLQPLQGRQEAMHTLEDAPRSQVAAAGLWDYALVFLLLVVISALVSAFFVFWMVRWVV